MCIRDRIDTKKKTHEIDRILSKGKYVTLVFWQTWCGACIAKQPNINEAYKEYESKISFFGIVSGSNSSSEKHKLQNAVAKYKIKYPQVIDHDYSILQKYGIIGTPTFVVLGKNREVIYKGHSLPDWGSLISNPNLV